MFSKANNNTNSLSETHDEKQPIKTKLPTYLKAGALFAGFICDASIEWNALAWANRYWNRHSLSASAMNALLKALNLRSRYINEDAACKTLEKAAREEAKRAAVESAERDASTRPDCDLEIDTSLESSAWVITSKPPRPIQSTTIFYLHGGAFIHTLRPITKRFIQKLAGTLEMNIIMPDYPLAPRATAEEAYKTITEEYLGVIKLIGAENCIVMGDSAGGCYAAGLVEWLSEHEPDAIPAKLILLSPQLDGTLSNPEISKIEPTDYLLAPIGLRDILKVWADEMPLDDYRVSPLMGSNTQLSSFPPTFIASGTAEILYPDACLFASALKCNGIQVEHFIGDGLPHDFPILPIKEQTEVTARIKAFLLNN